MALGRLDSVTSPAQPRRSTALHQSSLTLIFLSLCPTLCLHGGSTPVAYRIPTVYYRGRVQEMQCWRKEKVRGNFPPPRRQQRASRSSSMGLVCAHLAFPQVLPTREVFSVLHCTKAYIRRLCLIFFSRVQLLQVLRPQRLTEQPKRRRGLEKPRTQAAA